MSRYACNLHHIFIALPQVPYISRYIRDVVIFIADQIKEIKVAVRAVKDVHTLC